MVDNRDSSPSLSNEHGKLVDICSKQAYEVVGHFYVPLQQTYFYHMEIVVGILMIAHQTLKYQIQTNQEIETTTLISDELQLFQQ